MKISSRQISIFTEEESTSSPVGFRANHTPLLVNDLERKMTGISGRKCLEQYGKFSQHTSWQRMYSDSLIGMPGWYSMRCRLIWKIKGTLYNRMYYQLAVLVLPTEEIEYGLLPTPMAQARDLPTQEQIAKRRAMYLNHFAAMGLLPTPTAMEVADVDMEKLDARRERVKAKGINGNGFGKSLAELGKKGLLPTPSAQEGYKATGLENQVSITKRVREAGGNVSQLNPQYIAEMMGFPVDWTLLPFQSGGGKASKPMEMQ